MLYRAALSSLSVARATSLDRSLIAYLESLCTRAYFFVYGAAPRWASASRRFFARDWPAAVRALWRETLVVGRADGCWAPLAGYLLVACAIPTGSSLSCRATWRAGAIPRATHRRPAKTLLYAAMQQRACRLFATFLFTHNAQIALLAFALGFAFCVPTAACCC